MSTFVASLLGALLASWATSRLVRYLVFTPRCCWLLGHSFRWDDYWLRGADGEPLALLHQCYRCGSYVATVSAGKDARA